MTPNSLYCALFWTGACGTAAAPPKALATDGVVWLFTAGGLDSPMTGRVLGAVSSKTQYTTDAAAAAHTKADSKPGHPNRFKGVESLGISVLGL